MTLKPFGLDDIVYFFLFPRASISVANIERRAIQYVLTPLTLLYALENAKAFLLNPFSERNSRWSFAKEKSFFSKPKRHMVRLNIPNAIS